MSLINEALKKAQRMRAENPPPGSPPGADGSPAPVIIRRGRPIPAQFLVFSILGGAVLIGAAVVTTLILLRPDEAPIAAVTPPATAVRSPAETLEAPVLITLPPVGPTLPTTARTPESASEGNPAPATTVAAPVSTAAASPPAATPGPTPMDMSPAPVAGPPAGTVPIPVPAAKPDIRVQEFIDALRVSGIRASPTDPRVSMNDRVFRLNDIVDRNLGLRITGIESSGLTFVDAAGVEYTKSF